MDTIKSNFVVIIDHHKKQQLIVLSIDEKVHTDNGIAVCVLTQNK